MKYHPHPSLSRRGRGGKKKSSLIKGEGRKIGGIAMKRITVRLYFVFLILTFSLAPNTFAAESENFKMPLSTVDSGGGCLSSESFNAGISTGQSTPIGISQSGSYINYAGFQQPDEFYPTAITLSSFIAKTKEDGVVLKWQTETEIENVGFNILRSDSENGDYAKINKKIIKAKGSATKGAEYKFVDGKVKVGKTYYYKLEDIDRNTGSTLHGPKVVKVSYKKKGKGK